LKILWTDDCTLDPMDRGLDSLPLHLRRIAAMPRSTGPRGVPLAIYQHLLEINAGFEQVRVALAALDQSAMFDRGELKRFSALSAEARAAIASYLAGVVETEETDEAGRLFRLRRARERAEEAAGE